QTPREPRGPAPAPLAVAPPALAAPSARPSSPPRSPGNRRGGPFPPFWRPRRAETGGQETPKRGRNRCAPGPPHGSPHGRRRAAPRGGGGGGGGGARPGR